jgi:hypothetical protein
MEKGSGLPPLYLSLSWACSEFYQTYPCVTNVAIIDQVSPMSEISKFPTLGDLSYQSSPNQINGSL